MDELPELPFEQVLCYLSLEELIKARAVSRRWYHRINSFPVKTLCYSGYPIGCIGENNRWVSGVFGQNFISSTRFATFFDTFGQTILSSLKHLRLCGLCLREGDHAVHAVFPCILNSFSQLEQLDIFSVEFNNHYVLSLNLPMLTILELRETRGMKKLTLDARRLREVKLLGGYRTKLRVEIVHGESVERLLTDRLESINVKNLKNLQYLCADYLSTIDYGSSVDRTLVSSLQKLKEIHLQSKWNASNLFGQKQRSGRANLKIYLRGLLLNGPDDLATNALEISCEFLQRKSLACLAENRSRLADQIPFYRSLHYSAIEGVASGLEVDIVKRCNELSEVTVDSPVHDTQRFFGLLMNCKNIVELDIRGDQPQDLFDRLPEYCAVQSLILRGSPSDLAFLFRLKHLILLNIYFSIDSETVRRAFEKLPLLSYFLFRYDHKKASIRIGQSKQFHVSGRKENTTVSDLNAAIEFL